MSAMQRNKGANFEREVVRRAREMGLTAERALTQTRDSTADADVTIQGLRCECKHHARIAGWERLVTAALLGEPARLTNEQQRWLQGHDCLILRQTGWPEPLVLGFYFKTPVTLARLLAHLQLTRGKE